VNAQGRFSFLESVFYVKVANYRLVCKSHLKDLFLFRRDRPMWFLTLALNSGLKELVVALSALPWTFCFGSWQYAISHREPSGQDDHYTFR
jgi:hypothetical protein